MLSTFIEIIKENWQWRQQIFNLARIDLRKVVRGAVLGRIWLLVKPLTYIFVFWFALQIGLKQGNDNLAYPYILWLACGLVPWFFMSDILNTGSNVYGRYPFLVNRIHFPLSAISTFYSLSQFFIFLLLMALVLGACIIGGVHLSIYLLQLIPVALLMLLFWILFSILTSPLSALSKDFYNLLKALNQPLFWLSGIIFDVSKLPFDWLSTVLAFNPVTFFATAVRASVCENYWLWEKPSLLIPFCIVFAITLLAAVWSYKKLRKDVADVL